MPPEDVSPPEPIPLTLLKENQAVSSEPQISEEIPKAIGARRTRRTRRSKTKRIRNTMRKSK
jgi:hypothetical protein